MILGSDVINNGKALQLKDLGYKEMAGTYQCTATGIGGQNSGSSVLEVYCKYYSLVALKREKKNKKTTFFILLVTNLVEPEAVIKKITESIYQCSKMLSMLHK